MQKQSDLSAIQSLRFKRWSRKGYAAFASMHQHVTIGCLAVAVSDSSCRKQQQLSDFNNSETCKIPGEEAEESLWDQLQLVAMNFSGSAPVNNSFLMQIAVPAASGCDWFDIKYNSFDTKYDLKAEDIRRYARYLPLSFLSN